MRPRRRGPVAGGEHGRQVRAPERPRLAAPAIAGRPPVPRQAPAPVRSPAGAGCPASFARKHAAATAIEALDDARPTSCSFGEVSGQGHSVEPPERAGVGAPRPCGTRPGSCCPSRAAEEPTACAPHDTGVAAGLKNQVHNVEWYGRTGGGTKLEAGTARAGPEAGRRKGTMRWKCEIDVAVAVSILALIVAGWSAYGASRSADAAEDARDAVRLELRAWLGYTEITLAARRGAEGSWEDREPMQGDHGRIRLFVANTGKTPATNVRFLRQEPMLLRDGAELEPPEPSESDWEASDLEHVVVVRQANWRRTAGGSPAERRSNQPLSPRVMRRSL